MTIFLASKVKIFSSQNTSFKTITVIDQLGNTVPVNISVTSNNNTWSQTDLQNTSLAKVADSISLLFNKVEQIQNVIIELNSPIPKEIEVWLFQLDSIISAQTIVQSGAISLVNFSSFNVKEYKKDFSVGQVSSRSSAKFKSDPNISLDKKSVNKAGGIQDTHIFDSSNIRFSQTPYSQLDYIFKDNVFKTRDNAYTFLTGKTRINQLPVEAKIEIESCHLSNYSYIVYSDNKGDYNIDGILLSANPYKITVSPVDIKSDYFRVVNNVNLKPRLDEEINFSQSVGKSAYSEL